MTAINPALAARIAELGVPLSADLAPLTAAREADIRKMPVAPAGLYGLGHHGSDTERRLYGHAAELHTACGELLAELDRLRGELKERAMEFAVCYPDGATVMAETVTGDRPLAEARLRAHRETSHLWADCRLVQRTGQDGAWTEAGR